MNSHFEIDGFSFRATLHRDEDMGPPWKEHDGHGIVSDWRPRHSKRAGERQLTEDRYGSARFYDVAATIAKAREEGWGIGEAERAELAAKLGREPTPREIVAEAVERDFRHLQEWCNDDWEWAIVQVMLLDEDGHDTGITESVGGVESNAGDYLDTLAEENAREIISRIGADTKELVNRVVLRS